VRLIGSVRPGACRADSAGREKLPPIQQFDANNAPLRVVIEHKTRRHFIAADVARALRCESNGDCIDLRIVGCTRHADSKARSSVNEGGYHCDIGSLGPVVQESAGDFAAG